MAIASEQMAKDLSPDEQGVVVHQRCGALFVL